MSSGGGGWAGALSVEQSSQSLTTTVGEKGPLVGTVGVMTRLCPELCSVHPDSEGTQLRTSSPVTFKD